jgi:hypothetical protein
MTAQASKIQAGRRANRATRRVAKSGADQPPDSSPLASASSSASEPPPGLSDLLDAGRSGPPIVVELSQSQVNQVLREAAKSGSLSALFAGFGDLSSALALESASSASQQDEQHLSKSLLRGLLVLACLPSDGTYLGTVEVTRALGLSGSTTHRYLCTLVAAGLVERSPARKYRRATTSYSGRRPHEGGHTESD